MSAFTMPSDEAMAHLAMLLSHRPDPEHLIVNVYPRACPQCQELAAWAEFLTPPGGDTTGSED